MPPGGQIRLSTRDVRVVVPRAGDDEQLLRRLRELEEPPRVRGRRDVVEPAGDEELRLRHPDNLRCGVEPGPDEKGGQERVVHAGERLNREERRFERDSGAGSGERDLDGHRTTERLAQKDDPLGPETALPRRVVNREAVPIETGFRRSSLREAVAAVVDEEEVDAQPVHEELRAIEPMADVPRVAVEEEDDPTTFAMDPPSVEANAVGGDRPKLLPAQAVVGGRRVEPPERKVEKTVFEEAHELRCRGRRRRMRTSRRAFVLAAAALAVALAAESSPPPRSRLLEVTYYYLPG